MGRFQRVIPADKQTNPVDGNVHWSPFKSIWYSTMLVIGLVGGFLTYSFQAALVGGLLTAFTLCVGHSVGLHRLLIHRSFKTAKWLEYFMVSTGVLVGMGGPKKMLYMHDIRDWAQRTSDCHPFLKHSSFIVKDWIYNLHCELRFKHPPIFRVEPRVVASVYYDWLDRNWMLLQLPLGIALYFAGGIPFVIWGIFVRVAMSLTGHWLVGFLAHNVGHQPWLVKGAAVQGYNVPGLGLITMGESLHNNHHAFPESARLGTKRGQMDAGELFVHVEFGHRFGAT